ncbi:MAG: SUMF1/EgtB/PvdO family nonheme iron enzyme [Magnetococcus sp. DMHC-1]
MKTRTVTWMLVLLVMPWLVAMAAAEQVVKEDAEPQPDEKTEVRMEAMNREMVTRRIAKLRTEPSENGKILVRLREGAKVHVLGLTEDRRWYLVEATMSKGIKKGYVFMDSLVEEKQQEDVKINGDAAQQPGLETERKAQEKKQVHLETERKVQEEQQARMESEHKVREEEQARMESERKAREEQQARMESERKAREEQQARMESERKAKEEQQVRLESERKAKEEQQDRMESERKAKEALQSRLEAERMAQKKEQTLAEMEHKAWESVTEKGTAELLAGMEFVRVPGGEFEMGCGAWQSECEADEKPAQRVNVGDFEIGKYEVTQGQWKTVMGSNPSHFDYCGDDCPVENISWDDARGFINQLNAQNGNCRYRLPTESEWEYACRSGGKEEKYCGGGLVDLVAWYKNNSGERPRRVGKKSPNKLGIHDMSGNVWEMTCSDRGLYNEPEKSHTRCSHGGSFRVNRGGSWINGAAQVRFADRNYTAPGDRYHILGLRLVRICQ